MEEYGYTSEHFPFSLTLIVVLCEILTGYDLIALIPRFYLVRVQKCGALHIFVQV
jgi:hypothetical protein